MCLANGIQIPTVENPIQIETIHIEPQKQEKKPKDILHLLKGIKGINPILPKKENLVLQEENLINQLEKVPHPIEVHLDLVALQEVVLLTEAVLQKVALQKEALEERETKRLQNLIKLFP